MENYEIVVPFQALQAIDCHVDAVYPKKGTGDICATVVHDFEGDQNYSEKPGHLFKLTASYEGLNASTYDALVIPGGRAPEYLALDETVIKLVKEFMEVGKPIASICHGQQILSAVGALKDEDVYSFFEPELPSESIIGLPRAKINDFLKSPGERRHASKSQNSKGISKSLQYNQFLKDKLLKK